MKLLAGPEGGIGSARINQDAHMFVAEMANGVEIPYTLRSKRAAWGARGSGGVAVNGIEMHTGDAAAVSGEEKLALTGAGSEPSEILLFDLA